MKRRGFLGALAAMVVVRKIEIPTDQRLTMITGGREVKESLPEFARRLGVEMTPAQEQYARVRTGLPPVAWRRLNSPKAVVDILKQQNDILNDLEWK